MRPEASELSPEEWERLWEVAGRLAAANSLRQLAAELASGAITQFPAAAAQVGLRSGELDPTGLALARHSNTLNLSANRQKIPGAPPPRHLRISESLAGFVASEGESLAWNLERRAAGEWEDCRWGARLGLREALALPLMAQGLPFGVFLVWGSGESPLGAARLFHGAAQYAVHIIQHLRRNFTTQRQVEWLTAIQQVTGVLASQLSPADLYHLIFSEISRILPLDRFAIHLLDDSGRNAERALVAENSAGQWRFLPPQPPMPVSGEVWQRAIWTREPILLNRPAAAAAPAAGAFFVSEMHAPMLLGERVIGVMEAQSATPAAYDQEALDLLATVANQAALTIENARLLYRLNRQIHETEKANRYKSQFIANISHEIRTPLNSIIGFTRIVKRRAQGALPAQQAQNLDYVLESARHLLRIIDELLDLSRLEAGRITIEADEVDLRRLVAQVMAELEPQAHQNNNRMEVDLIDPGETVMTDPTRVRQILFNLLSNALKFTKNGVIRVAAGRSRGIHPPVGEGWIVLKGSQESDTPPCAEAGENAAQAQETRPRACFFLEVADTGVGMRPDMVAEMFEEFRQASAGDRRKYSGAGLGLSIVRRITEMMNGTVWVKTAPDQGSGFRVTLAEMRAPREGGGASA